ncbi:hypothetical protein SAMN05421679_102369 [Epilithonimonas pallida]|uniref:Uncharacterized protein n=1 Tax=Epilithonimonas pallida TaxID=373671 RepID=A0ABY1R024_9FLAO|nr:hypothetical protein SAMN05421679_102369 [Epilithonimonas pallida]
MFKIGNVPNKLVNENSIDYQYQTIMAITSKTSS